MYVFVVLKRGDNKIINKSFIDSCFKEHLANNERISETSEQLIAGTFWKNDSNFRETIYFYYENS
jgi:hypothetical protein